MKIYNELQLAKELMKFPSVTPVDAGTINFLAKKLRSIGFRCKILEFKSKNSKPIKNLYAVYIIKTVDEKTRSKTSLNDLLRD